VTVWLIDSSVAFSWVHPDQATHETNQLLREIETGAPFVVPLLWFTEVANGLLVLQRRKKITAKDRATALQTLAALNPTIDEESGHAAFTDVSDLAETYGLTVYDATYLEVALRRKLTLASRDEPLNKAAKQCGISLM